MSTPQLQDAEAPSPVGFGHWIKKHPYAVLGIAITAVVASFALGAWLGSWATCRPRCGFSVEMFGAIGTWVGGLGTAGALVFTALTITHTWRKQQKADELQANEILTEARTVDCFVPAQTVTTMEEAGPRGGMVFHLSIQNKSDSPITDVRGWSKSSEKEIFQKNQINRNLRGRPFEHKFSIHLADFAEEIIPHSAQWLGAEEEKYKKLRHQYESMHDGDPKRAGAAFNMRELEKFITTDKEKLAEALKDDVVVEFTMKGRKFSWHKDGDVRAMENPDQ